MYTDNAVQIETSIIPAYERERMFAERAGDAEHVAAIEAEIERARRIAGLTETKKRPPKATETRTK